MFFLLAIIFGFLQMTVLDDVNLLLVLAIFAGLRKGPFLGALVSCAIGIFVDVLSGCAFGLNVALYSAIGLVAGFASEHMSYKENIFMQFIFSFLGLGLFYLLYSILGGVAHPSFFTTILFSAVISPLVFKIADGRRRTI
ncbi:hypothetical protein ACFL2G_01760 [Candidatus Omnitrophota bacterium]